MIRNPVLTSLFAVVLLMSCAAQDERRSLENSVTRLEQRLARMDEYLKSLQSSQSQQKEEKLEALQEAKKELSQLRELVLAQEKAMREATAATEQKLEAMRKAADQQAAQQEKATAEAKRKEQALAQEAERARADSRRKEQAAAQEAERAKVAESKARAEQQALAEKARSLAQELEQSKKAANDRAAESAKLAKEKEALVAAAKQQRDRTDSEQEEQKRVREANRKQVEDLQRQLAAKEADGRKRGDEYTSTIERLSQERREIERLRDSVKNDLATEARRADEAAKKRADTQELKAREANDEMAKLRSQNASLKKQLQALEQAKDQEPAKAQLRLPPNGGFDDFGPAPTPARAAPAPARNDAPPGTIIINNSEGGEVHFHFHGATPTIDQQAQPRATPKKGPPPSLSLQADKGPAIFGLEAAPDPQPKTTPRKSEKAEPAEKPQKVKSKDPAPKNEDAKKINEDAELVARNIVRVLWGAF